MQESVKQDRDKYIGGSDIPIIMEISSFKSRYDLLLEKAGLNDNDFDGNVYTEYGNTMEPKIREYVNRSFKVPFRFKEGKHVREAEDGEPIGIRCHTDGENQIYILEIKTTSQIYETVDEYKAYLVQLLFYMMETEKKSGLLVVYERPDDLSEELDPDRIHRYSIDLDDYKGLTEDIKRAVERFKEDLGKLLENPFLSEEDLLPSEIPDITARIIAFEERISQMKDLEKQIKSEKARLKEAMEAVGVKTFKTPSGYKITLVADGEDKVIEETVLNQERLKSEAPEIYLKFTETKKTVKKGKAGYVLITEPKKDKEGKT